MSQQEEIVLWIDRRWKSAIEKHLKDENLQEHLENVLDELCNQLPEREYERISRAIQSEAAAQRAEEEAARTYKQSDNSISLEVLSEEATAVVSIEDEYMEQISADEAAVLVRLLRQGLSSHLTETQRRRLWKYCVEGKPVRLIAKEECAYRNAVWKSIQAAKEKMFKFLVETGCAKPRFRRDR